jgi:hypothetical protein
MTSSDIAVQLVARTAAPALLCNVAVSIFANAVDEVMFSQDFSFMLTIGLSTFVMRLMHLSYCTSVSEIFLRVYSLSACFCALLAYWDGWAGDQIS